MARKKVVIIGGGFGGLNAAHALRKADVDLLLIDKANHHLFQPLLYQVATAALSPSDIAYAIREILSKQANITVMLAEIVAIDKEKNEVISENGDRYPFDILILAPGSRQSYFGKSEWEALAPGMKTLDDAVRIRERILLSYERAERTENHEEALKFMRFIIIGGGPTGVEMAGAICEIARESLVRDFRYIKPEETKVYLIEGEPQILPSFPPVLEQKAKRQLEKLGVELVLGARVTNVTTDGVWIGDKFIASPNIIWAAGNAVSPIIKTLNIPLDRAGRAHVNPDLSIPDNPHIFVIGDAALLNDEKGVPLPGLAPVAMQQGRYVANIIKENAAPDQRKPFKYWDKGMMATIGKAKAIAVVGKIHLSGTLAWMAWSLIHIAYLISFANKVLVMSRWFFLYLFNQRRVRLITRPISDEDDPLHKK